MRKFFTLLWLLFPVAVLYYHFNEGQEQLVRVEARQHAEAIRELELAEEPDWPTIIEEYDRLDSELPEDEAPLVRHQIRLAQARAKLEMLDIAGAIISPTIEKRARAAVKSSQARTSVVCRSPGRAA